MKKILSIFVTLAMALAANIALVVDSSEAVPAFARQMQMSCKGCHFQHFPKLNAMGRAFKANGYTDVAVETIDGDWGTSIPINLNASWITKLRYVKDTARAATNMATGTVRGEYQAVDEGTFFIGGRISEHIGGAIEVADGIPWGNGTIVFGHDLETINTHAGLALWSADGAGPFWGKDIFNTGLIRAARSFENRGMTQAADVIFRMGTWSGATIYGNHDWIFAALSLAVGGQHGVDVGGDFSWVYRVAITPPQIWGFDTMIGVYGMWGGHSSGGTAAGGTGSRTQMDTNFHGVDFQAQGNLTDGITLEITGNILYDTGDPSARNMVSRGGQDHFRLHTGFDLGLLEDRLIGKFMYSHFGSRAANSVRGAYGWERESVDIVSLGLYYNITENVSLRPEVSFVVGSDTDNVTPTVGMVRGAISADTSWHFMLWYAF